METTTTLNTILTELGLDHRPEQDKLGHLLYDRSPDEAIFVQAGTGVGKSFALIGDALDQARRTGQPSIIVTPTNKLTEQYVYSDLPKVAQAVPHTFVRVIGASHYVCADSEKGPAFYTSDPEDRHIITADRDAWLRNVTQPTDDIDPGLRYATEFERGPANLPPSYGCPGYPHCEGGLLGGCGAKKARARSAYADIVITNGHVLSIDQMVGGALLPFDPAVTHIDEAHTLPTTIRDCRTVTLSRQTGDRVFSKPTNITDDDLTNRIDNLKHDVQNLIVSILDSPRWSSDYDVDSYVGQQFATPKNRKLASEIEWFVNFGLSNPERDSFEEDGTKVTDLLLRLMRRDRSLCAVIERPEKRHEQPKEIKVVDMDAPDRAMRGFAGAAVSATLPDSLPRTYGEPDISVEDVGHPFDYKTNVAGYLSTHSGVKSGSREWYLNVYLPTQERRLDELAQYLQGERSLVLCSSHKDAEKVAKELTSCRFRVFRPDQGGSVAAARTEQQFREHHGPAVLVGTDTYATGMDLPGDLLTLVAWWSVPYGITSKLDQHIDRRYPGTNRDNLRIKVAQGVGRLLRKTTDTGTVVLCDSRFGSELHIDCSTHTVDQHLSAIDWEWIG